MRRSRSFANRSTPAKIESGSRCASAITSASRPPLLQELSKSDVSEYSSVNGPRLRSGHMRRLRLAIEQLLADGRDHLYVHTGRFEFGQHFYEIHRGTRALRDHITVAWLA